MSTIEQIESFANFALAAAQAEGEQASIDSLYERWREQQLADVDARAVLASVRELERGERGEPVEEFLARFAASRLGSTP